MVPVGGRSLLAYHLDNFSRLGVDELVVVTGFEADTLRRRIDAFDTEGKIRIRCAFNPRFDARNGLSVLAGVDALDTPRPFWLTMSDHVFDPSLFSEIAALWASRRHRRWQGALFVDRKLHTIFDMPDATKVRTDPDDFAIGKELVRFDAVDTGLFWCAPGFVDALRAERARCGDCSTSDAVRRLVKKKRFGFVDIGEYFWQDVDTPEARDHAEMLIRTGFEPHPGKYKTPGSLNSG